MLDTGAELFAEQGYNGFSITELCRRAGVSAGSLYGRITGKDALILAIHDRELTRISAENAIFADHDRWAGLSTEDLVYDAVRELGRHQGRHAAILRGFILRAAVDETMRQHGAVFSAAMASVFTDLLMTRAADIPHPDPVLAVHVTYQIARASLSWRIAFGDAFASNITLDWDSYVAQIAASARAYLMTAPAITSGGSSR